MPEIQKERLVLGDMLTSREALAFNTKCLFQWAFHEAGHRMIFCALRLNYFRSGSADLTTAVEELKAMGKLDAVGGAPYLTGLIESAEPSGFEKRAFHFWLERMEEKRAFDFWLEGMASAGDKPNPDSSLNPDSPLEAAK